MSSKRCTAAPAIHRPRHPYPTRVTPQQRFRMAHAAPSMGSAWCDPTKRSRKSCFGPTAWIAPVGTMLPPATPSESLNARCPHADFGRISALLSICQRSLKHRRPVGEIDTTNSPSTPASLASPSWPSSAALRRRSPTNPKAVPRPISPSCRRVFTHQETAEFLSLGARSAPHLRHRPRLQSSAAPRRLPPSMTSRLGRARPSSTSDRAASSFRQAIRSPLSRPTSRRARRRLSDGAADQ